MAICSGRGSSGDHCCYIAGEVCQFLFTDRGGTPRCSLFDQWGQLNDNPEWVAAPVGQFFARLYPGYDCGDWPQKIPAVMSAGVDLCCWSDE